MDLQWIYGFVFLRAQDVLGVYSFSPIHYQLENISAITR